MRVSLLLFAALRDVVGTDRQELDLVAGSSARDLWERLRQAHPELERYRTAPMIAVNQSYVPPETALQDGDEVALIPPVAGG
ncbi:MAG TPA: molybdopterin converting factor subunit 1 [Thermoanaerobaculia bacterium]|nr:molybdopterin converting factor subunit 1 [Thermoanaerobaculia bacterium]